MNRKKRRIIVKAAELVASHEEFHSCLALSKVEFNKPGYVSPLRKEYAKFYGRDTRYKWPFKGIGPMTREVRVLLLLTFAEMG